MLAAACLISSAWLGWRARADTASSTVLRASSYTAVAAAVWFIKVLCLRQRSMPSRRRSRQRATLSPPAGVSTSSPRATTCSRRHTRPPLAAAAHTPLTVRENAVQPRRGGAATARKPRAWAPRAQAAAAAACAATAQLEEDAPAPRVCSSWPSSYLISTSVTKASSTSFGEACTHQPVQRAVQQATYR